MKKNNLGIKILFFIVVFTSCNSAEIPTYSTELCNYRFENKQLIMESNGVVLKLNPVTLETLIENPLHDKVIISEAVFKNSKYKIFLDQKKIEYPKDDLIIHYSFENNTLTLTFSTSKPQSIKWPSISMEKENTALIWPHYEGNYIPLNDKIWVDFLESQSWNTTVHQYMPFWGIEKDSQLLTYIVENPFHNNINFKVRSSTVNINLTHDFMDNNDLTKPITFIVHLDYNKSPITPAKHFREYLKSKGNFVTLKDKIKIAPKISQLIGAPHAYVWLGDAITMNDIKENKWQTLASEILDQDSLKEKSLGRQIIKLLDHENNSLVEMVSAPTSYEYLRIWMTESLSKVLKSSKLYNNEIWPLNDLPESYRDIAQLIIDGHTISTEKIVFLNSFLLYSEFSEYLYIPSSWGNGVSTRMIDKLIENNMERFVLTCNGVENIEIRPHVASYSSDKGYLIGPYDEYYSVHDPNESEWPTAKYDDDLFNSGGITKTDGSKIPGFGGVGYMLSPIAVEKYFKERISKNLNNVPYSYYFLDCDGWGEYFDDYSTNRKVSASEDAEARISRVDYIFRKYKIPVGTEGGSYLLANSLAVAEGVFMPTINGIIDDPDLNVNEMSKYFLGRSFPGYEPEQFFLPVSLKEKYVHLYSDPRFRLPLYEAVFHDSIITTPHYASGSLKFTNIAETGALTEILYQVAPMYHLNLDHFENIKNKIKNHNDVFRKTHSYSYQYALEAFEYITTDRLVQKTTFGNLEIIANFKEEPFSIDKRTLSGRSLLITYKDTGESFVYQNSDLSEDITYTKDIEKLIKGLQSDSAEIRVKSTLAISNMGIFAKKSIPLLIENLNDEEWQVRRPVAYAIAALGKNAKDAIPSLIYSLNDEEWQVRKPVALALASMGKDAKNAIPALIEKLNDPEIQVRDAVNMALNNIQ